MFYSVAVGRRTGVFLTWALVSPAVVEYPGVVIREWVTLREAVQHLNTCGIVNPDVHTPEGTMSLVAYYEQRGSGNAFYSVVIGRRAGVFLSWTLCYPVIFEFPETIYCKWKTLAEATQHLNRHGIENHEIEVHMPDGIVRLHEYCEQNGIYSCTVCERLFTRAYSVRRHMREVHGSTHLHNQLMHNIYPCTICERHFTRPYRARRHMREVHNSPHLH